MNDPNAELKLSRLRSMQRFATSLLVVMLALLVLCAALRSTYPWLQWVQAFAAAASVGAIADWFAVVALFHHPLGVRFPHTAIVPENKDRIGASLGEFVEHNFLTAENVVRKLEERNLSSAAADWLCQRPNSERLAERACALIPDMLDAFEDEDVRRFVDRMITPQLQALDLAGIAGSILSVLTAEGRHQQLLSKALQVLEAWLSANRATIKAKFGEASKYTPGFLDSYIVNRFVDGILGMLREVARNPEHEMRRRFDAATDELVRKLSTSAEFKAQAEIFKRELIDHLEREAYYQVVWRDVKQRLIADLALERSMIRSQVADAFVKLAAGLKEDHALQEKLNAWLLKAIEAVVIRHRHQVSTLITDVVKGWDAREITQKMELEIGKDLQYIRINGTIVGGTVGLLLHAVTG
jgi:uncharacterized membrane-anchored protein YjiN (DUF445 family)